MPKDATGARGWWWRFSDYEISDGYIRPARGAKLERYDPWQEYRKGKPEFKERKVQPPYAELVNLFPERVIDANNPLAGHENATLGWCRKYGLLGILPHKTQIIAFPAERRARSRVHRSDSQKFYVRTPEGWEGRTQHELRFVDSSRGGIEGADSGTSLMPPHALVYQHGLMQEKSLGDALGEFFPSVPEESRDDYRYPLPLSDDFWRVYAESGLEFRRVAVELGDALRALGKTEHVHYPRRAPSVRRALDTLYGLAGTVRPVLTPVTSADERRKWELCWASTSLIGALALMAIMDIGEARRLVNCEACGRLCVTPAYQANYCSKTCYHRAAKRRQRARKKAIGKRPTSGRGRRRER